MFLVGLFCIWFDGLIVSLICCCIVLLIAVGFYVLVFELVDVFGLV